MQTTVIGAPDFSDAANMIEACHVELLRAGFVKEADSIRGAEVYSMASARTTLATLKQIKVDDEDVSSAVRYAVAILETLLGQPRVLAAAS